jgi:hypothetical protein
MPKEFPSIFLQQKSAIDTPTIVFPWLTFNCSCKVIFKISVHFLFFLDQHMTTLVSKTLQVKSVVMDPLAILGKIWDAPNANAMVFRAYDQPTTATKAS